MSSRPSGSSVSGLTASSDRGRDRVATVLCAASALQGLPAVSDHGGASGRLPSGPGARDRPPCSGTRTRREDRPPAAECQHDQSHDWAAGAIPNVAVEYGHLPADPAAASAASSRPQSRNGLTSTQRRRLRRCLTRRRSSTGNRGLTGRTVNRRGQLATLLFAGPRIGEFLSLRNRDVDLAGGWITVTESKTDAGRGRKVKIRPVLRDADVRVAVVRDRGDAAGCHAELGSATLIKRARLALYMVYRDGVHPAYCAHFIRGTATTTLFRPVGVLACPAVSRAPATFR
jgi:hypothetical protein